MSEEKQEKTVESKEIEKKSTEDRLRMSMDSLIEGEKTEESSSSESKAQVISRLYLFF